METELSKIGKNFVVGLSSTKLLDAEKGYLKELNPLGIVIFAKNIDKTEPSKWKSKLSDLISEVKDILQRNDAIISVDHEGGKVHRFVEPVTKFKSAKNWLENTKFVAQLMALELRELGFNLSYSPVLDIHSEETNPVIGDRAFANNVEDVMRYGKVFYESLETSGILACGKHFPGHGATVSDSHLELPKLDIDITLLEQRELRPFKSLIEIGLSLVMTAHVLYPKIDVHPATLSSVILKDILRKKMNYTGVVISDDLEMKALSNMTVENKAVSAFSAGVDILLEAYPPENTLALDVACRMGRGIVHAIEKGVIAEAEIDGSHKRIDALVARLGNLSNLTIASDGKELRELLKDIIIA